MIKLLDRYVNGKYHKRQKRIDHADHDSAFIIKKLDGQIDNSQFQKNRIDDTLGAENNDPRIGADNKINPERNHAENQSFLANLRRHSGDVVSKGVAHENRADCSNGGYKKSLCKNRNIKGIKKTGVISESPTENNFSVRRTARQGHGDDNQHGNDEKHHQPQKRGREKKFAVFIHFSR